MYQIYNVNASPKSVIECVKYIQSKWGYQEKFSYFENAILNSSKIEDSIPQFYVLLNDNEVVGCFGHYNQ